MGVFVSMFLSECVCVCACVYGTGMKICLPNSSELQQACMFALGEWRGGGCLLWASLCNWAGQQDVGKLLFALLSCRRGGRPPSLFTITLVSKEWKSCFIRLCLAGGLVAFLFHVHDQVGHQDVGEMSHLILSCGRAGCASCRRVGHPHPPPRSMIRLASKV